MTTACEAIIIELTERQHLLGSHYVLIEFEV
jgi:hypothetical protein